LSIPGIARLDGSIALPSLLALIAALLLCGALASRADAGDWGAPFDLSATGQRAERVRLGADAAGDQFAVWQFEEGSEWTVQAATRPVGGDWGAPVDVSAPASQEPFPALAVNATGEAVIVWSQEVGPKYVIEVAHGGVDDAWTSPTAISDPTTNSFEPAAGIDAAGDVTAAWRQYLIPNYGVAVASETAGIWSSPQVLSSPADTNESPTVAVDPAGDALVGWERSEVVEASNRPAGGSWSSATVVQAGGQGIASLQLAINGNGEAIATWENSAAGGSSHWVIESARMGSSGSWTSAEALTSVADFARNPAVALADDGEARVAWGFSPGGPGSGEIQTAASSVAGVWSSPTVVSSSGEAFEPAVGIDSLGNTTISWWSWVEPGNYAAFASRLAAGGSWGPELALSEPGEEIYYPALAVDGTGGATVAWTFYSEAGEETVRTVGLEGVRPAVPSGDGSTGGGGDSTGGDKGASKAATEAGPILCTAPSGAPSAASFVPVAKPGRTVPGVRARITVGSPSQVSVAATILYKQGGKRRSADAGTWSLKVKDARNLKVPLPSSLRSQLPVGSSVGVSLRIAATPKASGCGGAPKTATKNLRLKVVRVLTGSN
jgi:hypothetical protein